MADKQLTLEECRCGSLPPALPKLAKSDIQMLWISGFWDGALSGLLLHAGREYWFEMLEENENDDTLNQWYRRYAVVELTPDQLAYEQAVNDDFRKYVGNYWDCMATKPRGFHPQAQHHLYYDKHGEYCQKRNYETSPVVAWFET